MGGNMSEIVAGDVATLKSGGPEMTVTDFFKAVDGKIKASCSWFNGQDSKEDTFPLTALKKNPNS
jgi:uncharacterized protein YodC (DUF2158 family)